MQKPVFRPYGWIESEIEDYRKAKTDDERRLCLLTFGYDKAHEKDFLRLFPEDQMADDAKNGTSEIKDLAVSTLDKMEAANRTYNTAISFIGNAAKFLAFLKGFF